MSRPCRRRPVPVRVLHLGIAAAAAILAWAAVAQDPPHWKSTTLDINCTSQCHTPHQATGAGLATEASNAVLCQSCHHASGLASGLPIDSADKAVTGVTGVHHAFDTAAVNAALGTQEPLNAEMRPRVIGGNVVCSTCHNQHRAESAFRGRPRVSPAARTTALGSTGAVSSGGTFSGAEGRWYLVEIVAAGNEAGAEFRYSKDNGTSWFPTAPATLTAGIDVALDSGVTVSFATGAFAAGERWEFSASWPFLRSALDLGDNAAGDAFCRDCHRSWVMDTAAVETWDGGLKSHPVGVAHPTSNPTFHAVPLDGNGQPQGSAGADGNPTNDLALDGAGYVQCLSCHGVHYADSNTLTEDVP